MNRRELMTGLLAAFAASDDVRRAWERGEIGSVVEWGIKPGIKFETKPKGELL